MRTRQQRSGTENRRKARLTVELLEDRSLLDAAGLSSPLAHIALTPNDPSFGSQYALLGSSGTTAGPGINAQAAWNVTTGSMKTVIGVIDTGIDYDHPDLYQNVWINQAEIPAFWYTKSSTASTTYDKLVYKSEIQTALPGLITFRDLNNPVNKGLIWDNNGDGYVDAGDLLRPVSQGGWDSGSTRDGDSAHPDDYFGWNFVANSNNPFDDNGHGTHVSGIIGAQGNNGVGIAGIDWNVQMMALKVFDANGTGPVTNAIAALNYAVAHGAGITNNSWSISTANYQPLADAISNANTHGSIFVAAAGNYGVDTDTTPEYPASYNFSNVVSVAASNTSDTLAPYSDYGAHSVSIAAPGQNILSTYPGGKYQILSGTSMAAPQVTGTLGLIRSLHPDWSATQVINQLLSTADRLSSLNGKVESGLVDAAKAVGATGQTPPSTPPGTPTPPPTTAAGPRIIAFTPGATGSAHVSTAFVTFNEAINPTTFTVADVTLKGPSGTVAVSGVSAVAGSNNTKFEIIFPTQRTVGTYTLTVGPNVLDVHGTPMDQDQDGKAGNATTDRFSATFAIDPFYEYAGNGPLAIKGNFTTVSTVTLSKDITIDALRVKVLLSYPHISDLVIRLTGPDGTSVLLSSRQGTGNNLVSALFSDAASTTLSQSTGPYTGSYRPDNPLSVFHGKDARGTWTFSVQDAVANTSGMLHFFALDIDGAVGATAAAASVDDSGDQGTEATAASTAASTPAAPGSAAAATVAVSSVDAAQGTALPVYLFLGAGAHQSPSVEQVLAGPTPASSGVTLSGAATAETRLRQAATDFVFAAVRGSKRADPLDAAGVSAEQLLAYFEADTFAAVRE